MFKKIRGTQDFLDLTLFNFLIDKAKEHLSIYNFKEIATPIIEPLELYTRSLGEETDVVSKEMFIIKSQDDDETICLRPEVTASTARAFVEHHVETTPWKVFNMGPMFRYERPQKGRYRQFHQISMEIIGSKSINQDVHLLKMLDRFFFEVLQLNTYALIINFLGCHEDRQNFKVILKEFLDKNFSKICDTCKIRKDKNILRVFDCKNPTCIDIYESAPKITDYLCASCALEWTELKNNLELVSVSYSHNPKLVRGLDYYTKTVFEFVSQELGAQSTFCGGGRYDSLIKELSNKEDQPSLGAAIGIERVLLLLQNIKEKLPLKQAKPLNLILPLSHEQQALALLIADELNASDLNTDILLDNDSIKSMFRKANKANAAFVIIIGEDEQKTNTLTVKNMITGKEEKIAQRDVVNILK